MTGANVSREKVIDTDRKEDSLSDSFLLQNLPMNRRIPIGIPREKILIIKLSRERIADAVPTESGETNKDTRIQ